VLEYQSNLYWDSSARGNHAQYSDTTDDDVMVLSGTTNNAAYNGLASDKAGSSGTMYSIPTTGTLGANDLNGVDPGFVDPDRNFEKYATTFAQARSVENTLAIISADPVTQIPLLIAYVRAGFVPTAEEYRDAGADLVTIGAMEGSFDAETGEYLLTAPDPAAGKINTASGNFTVALDTGQYPGLIVFTPASDVAGTFTPETVTLSNFTRSGTFTFTPTETGTATITTTNDGSMTNPSGVAYESVEATPPAFASASINAAGNALTALFTEADSPPVLPASGVAGFSLAGTAATIASGTISGTTATFVLSGLVAQGETVTLSYDSGTGNVTDSATIPNALATFSGQAVTNNSELSTGRSGLSGNSGMSGNSGGGIF
jgi:hypothetical protein